MGLCLHITTDGSGQTYTFSNELSKEHKYYELMDWSTFVNDRANTKSIHRQYTIVDNLTGHVLREQQKNTH